MATAQNDTNVRAKRIKVKALRMGYYDHVRRREGDVFTVNETAFSENWMEKVSASTPERVTTGKDQIARENAAISGGRQAGTGDADPLGE